jgi:predicted DNA-binding transcriptional regulator AlpA
VARPIRAEDLVGAGEIVDRLGIASTSLVHDWMRRYDDFPEPIARLKGGSIWLWSEVEAWARRTGRV